MLLLVGLNTPTQYGQLINTLKVLFSVNVYITPPSCKTKCRSWNQSEIQDQKKKQQQQTNKKRVFTAQSQVLVHTAAKYFSDAKNSSQIEQKKIMSKYRTLQQIRKPVLSRFDTRNTGRGWAVGGGESPTVLSLPGRVAAHTGSSGQHLLPVVTLFLTHDLQ